MAGLRGNNAWWTFQKQTAKGTPATCELPVNKTAGGKIGAHKATFAAGDFGPNRVFGKLAETDANRNQGVSFAKTGGAVGNPETYGRDEIVGPLAAYCLGAEVRSGAEPNFIHKATQASTLPYVTFWSMVGGPPGEGLYEEFNDCMINSLQFKTTAGEPLTVAAGVLGLKSTRKTTDVTETPKIPLEQGYVYNYNDCTVTLAGGATTKIASFDLTYSNGVTSQQTDFFTPIDVVAGLVTVDLTFDMIFDSLIEYNRFNYGGEAGTAESNTLYTTSAKFAFEKAGSANNAIKFELPSIAYETFPVAANVTGAPIVVSVKAVAQRPALITESILTVETKNQSSDY